MLLIHKRLRNRKNISIGLIASFALTLALSYWLQSQLVPVSLSSLLKFRIEAQHSSSSVLNLVRESLEDSENRRVGHHGETELAGHFYGSSLRTIKSILYLELSQPGLIRANLYLDHRQLLI